MNDMSLPQPSQLAVWFSQKPTLALMGEFSAGKSTLLNLLLDSDILQTRVTATNMPVIWLTHASEPKAEGLSREGILTEFNIDALNDQGDQDYLVIRLSLPCIILEKVDIIDTPGISDGRLQAGALDFLGPYLDCVIWCSAANQAWRQTEKAMWTSLPEDLRAKSMLALTRSDTLRKKTDLQKVIRRCERETAGLFTQVFPISAVTALEAKTEGRDNPEPRKWAASHAPALFEKIDTAIELMIAECAARPILNAPAPSVEVEVAQTKKKLPPKNEIAANTELKAKTTQEPKAKVSRAEVEKPTSGTVVAPVSDLITQLCQLRATISHNQQFLDELYHILNAFKEDKSLSEGQKMVLSHTMSSDWPDTIPKTKLMAQLIRELNDFAESSWYALDQIY